jgi:hypothetical protein
MVEQLLAKSRNNLLDKMKIFLIIVTVILTNIGCKNEKEVASKRYHCYFDGKTNFCRYDSSSQNWRIVFAPEDSKRLTPQFDECGVTKESLTIKGKLTYSSKLQPELQQEESVTLSQLKKIGKSNFRVVKVAGITDASGRFSFQTPIITPSIWLLFTKEARLPALVEYRIY